MKGRVAILGIFVADLAFEAPRLPMMGETLLGEGFRMGPGGKGSNQAVAAAKAGADVAFITRLGADAFGEIALATWSEAGVDTATVVRDTARPTGAAFIFVSTRDGNNAIIVNAGAAGAIGPADLDAARDAIEGARVFVTQLEQPIDAAARGLAIARAAGVTTILNPAPAADLSDEILALCDYVTPNESEAAALTGIAVDTVEDARAAADRLIARGVGRAVLTLGERGALYHDGRDAVLVPAFSAGPVRDTTGAGDAFNGGFATALAEGADPLAAVRFACATGSLSVTRPGAAAAMPTRAEIDALLQGAPAR
ncbi:ribokinase [Acuticoccus kandeliae]|uniref:ribokinase n=1 Tax=Acuticoccus kandeliae TaxID=2073160 RepID=UPI000D3EAD06|nr:ribokinase [Acuticoccus kandeliae]